MKLDGTAFAIVEELHQGGGAVGHGHGKQPYSQIGIIKGRETNE
jgi:hypothetical protein